jgi:hypothetical protein
MDIEKSLKAIEEKYQASQIAGYTVPAGPDTSKFKETVSGMVRLVKDFRSYSGYGIDFAYAIQVGTAIPPATRAAISEEVSRIPHEGYYFHDTHGTSFCLYGFVKAKKRS